MKEKRVSPVRLVRHEFNRALRALRPHVPSIDVRRALVAERKHALMLAMRSLGLATLCVILIENNRKSGAVTIDLSFFEISIAIVYVNTIASFYVFGFISSVFSYFLLNEFVRIAGLKLFRFDNSTALGLFADGGTAWGMPANVQFRFLKSNKKHWALAYATMIFVLVPVVTLLAVVYVVVFGVALRSFVVNEALGWALSLVSIGFLIFPIVYVGTALVPFRFERNDGFIRWLFIRPMYRRLGKEPPRLSDWLR